MECKNWLRPRARGAEEHLAPLASTPVWRRSQARQDCKCRLLGWLSSNALKHFSTWLIFAPPLCIYETFPPGLMYKSCIIRLLDRLALLCGGDQTNKLRPTQIQVFPIFQQVINVPRAPCRPWPTGKAVIAFYTNIWMMFLSSFQHRIIQKVSEFRIKKRSTK